MKYLRSLLMIFAFCVFGLGAIVLNFLVFPVLKLLFKGQDLTIIYSNIIQNLWLFFLNLLVFIRLIKLEIKDKKALQNIKNKVIVATHPSFIDILILVALIPRSTGFAKKELTKNFILKNLVNSIFITNDLAPEELKSHTKKMLDMGFNVIIFPMGTRHRKDEYPKIKKGASLIALNSEKNIVPIKLNTTEDFLFLNQPFYEGGNQTVVYEIEVLSEINPQDYYNESEIIMKKNITKQIEQSLYS